MRESAQSASLMEKMLVTTIILTIVHFINLGYLQFIVNTGKENAGQTLSVFVKILKSYIERELDPQRDVFEAYLSQHNLF